MAAPPLSELEGGFRDRFLDYDELTAQLRAWADAYPDVVRLTSIGETPEGRQLWLLTLGPDPDRARPSAWIDGNMHAGELCGSSVALAIAEDVIRLHRGAAPADVPAPAVERLRDVRFFVLPRMSPDGAEAVVKTGRYVRSAPRDDRPQREHPRWTSGDIDGDGQALLMRIADPTGEYVESGDHPGLMLPRSLDDAGPFYKLYPEGTIDGYDGSTIPSPDFLCDNRTDFNRNFPYDWVPEENQRGAGSHPGSEPETRAVIEFASAHPEIFAWLNLHTFGGVFIRPLGDGPDSSMNQTDLAIYRQIEAWAQQLTGYPMVSGYEEFTYEPATPIRGDLIEYAYRQRGCVAYVVELWDLFEELGLPRPKRFVDRYTQLGREELATLARWDAEHNQQRLLRPWRAAEHPQLGPVEVGGLDPRIGITNPPLDRLAGICRQQSACFLRVAALAPSLHIDATVERRDETIATVTVEVANHGYLGTAILPSAAHLHHCEAPSIRFELRGEDCELLEPERRVDLGHLDGWGTGLGSSQTAIFYMRSRGSTGRRHITRTVRGRGVLTVRVGSCRVGWSERKIEV